MRACRPPIPPLRLGLSVSVFLSFRDSTEKEGKHSSQARLKLIEHIGACPQWSVLSGSEPGCCSHKNTTPEPRRTSKHTCACACCVFTFTDSAGEARTWSTWKKKKERKDNPREGWEDGTPPPHTAHRDFKERSVECGELVIAVAHPTVGCGH